MNLPPNSVNIFDSVKITRVWSSADQCDSGGPPCQSSHENNVSSTSSGETSFLTGCQQSLSSEKLPFPPLSDDKCLQLLNQSVIPTKMFENYLGRAKRKERERLKRCEVKKWWLTGKKFSNKKLTCSKCNRGFHKAFGLEVHSRRCRVSSAPQRKFHCEICQRKLRMANVKGHMKGKHQLELKEYGAFYQRRLFNCKICDADIETKKASVVLDTLKSGTF